MQLKDTKSRSAFATPQLKKKKKKTTTKKYPQKSKHLIRTFLKSHALAFLLEMIFFFN